MDNPQLVVQEVHRLKQLVSKVASLVKVQWSIGEEVPLEAACEKTDQYAYEE